jgi:MscS family membrane protein
MKIFSSVLLGLLCLSNLQAAPQAAPATVPPPAISPVSSQFHDDPVDTSSPRATMRSFYTAMQDYKQGLDTSDEKLKDRINDAIRCFDLSQLPPVGRRLAAQQSAIYLKEIIDRSVVMDYGKLPDTPTNWKSRSGTFVIKRKDGGDQDGEYLITAESLSHLPETFEMLKNHPYVKGGGGGAGYRAPWIDQYIPAWAFNRGVGLAYWQWIGLAVILLLGLVFRSIMRGVLGLCLRISSRSSMKWNSVLIQELTAPLALLGASVFWLVAVYGLRFSDRVQSFFHNTIFVLICYALIWTLYRLTHVLHLYLVEYAKRTDNNFDEQLVNLITRTLKVVVLVTGVLMALQNMGVQVFSVLAGLGIGGLAVALAAKDTLANFFGSIMIMVDRPFRVGHYIKVKDQEGTVEAIGFRSTKIRTPYNSLVSIPSSELSLASVDNLGMRQFRRVRTTLGITYDATPRQITEFVEGIKRIIGANPKCTPNCLVNFTEFNSSSLDILVNFFLDVPDVASEAEEKQKIYLEIMQLAQQVGVSFAFPSQSLYVEKLPSSKPANGE